MKFLNGVQPLSLLILRGVLALIFVYHGYPKLIHPDEGMREFFTQHGLPAYFLSVSGILECFGALLLSIGLFTRAVAMLLAGEMAVAIWKVHSGHGALVVKEYEFPLVMSAASFALATVGAGLFSVDHLVFRDASGKKRRSSSARNSK
jgi:putative oxidoreductase